MAHFSASHLSERFISARHLTRAAYVPPTAGVYRNRRFLSTRHFSERHFSVNADDAGSFNQAGTAGTVDVSGFAGGFPFIGQGASASMGSISGGWAGFGADPGGILDNDTSTEGPLSYRVVTQPSGGSLTAYAGGAFTWDPGAAPFGRYEWTYQLYENGVAGDIGTVTIEYGDLFASVSVSGFAGTLTTGSGFADQGTRGSVSVTGFSGDILLTFNDQGASASVGVQGYEGTLVTGQNLRGDAGTVDPQGFAGSLQGTFTQQGTTGSVDISGFAGTLNTGTFFNDTGTAGTVDVSGFAGTILTGSFVDQGSSSSLSVTGNSGFGLFGFNDGGTAGTVSVTGNAGTFGPPEPVPGENQDVAVSETSDNDVTISSFRDSDVGI